MKAYGNKIKAFINKTNDKTNAGFASSHDWKQLANVPFVMGLIRQKSLLDGNNEDADFKNYCTMLTAIINNFYLSIEMDVKVGKNGGYELCHLKGETKIARRSREKQKSKPVKCKSRPEK